MRSHTQQNIMQKSIVFMSCQDSWCNVIQFQYCGAKGGPKSVIFGTIHYTFIVNIVCAILALFWSLMENIPPKNGSDLTNFKLFFFGTNFFASLCLCRGYKCHFIGGLQNSPWWSQSQSYRYLCVDFLFGIVETCLYFFNLLSNKRWFSEESQILPIDCS